MFGFGKSGSAKAIRTVIMIVIYFVTAYLIQFTKMFDNLFMNAPQLRTGMAVLLAIYGLFRAYRLWKTL